MNFIFINKYFLLFSILLLSSCNSVERIADLNFNKKNDIPEIINLENNDNISFTNLNLKSNFTKKFYLENIKKNKKK